MKTKVITQHVSSLCMRFAFTVAYRRARRTARRPAGSRTRNSLQPRSWSKCSKGRRAVSGPRREEGQAVASCGAAPLPLAPVAATAGPGASSRGGTASAESSGWSRPSFPPALPRLPQRPEAARLVRRPLRWEKEEAARAGGAGSKSQFRALGTFRRAAHMSQKQGIWKRSLFSRLSVVPSRPPAPFRPLRFSSHSSPLLRFVLSLPLPVSSPGCPRLTLPFLLLQLAPPQARARLTGASTSSMERPSSKSPKVSTGR